MELDYTFIVNLLNSGIRTALPVTLGAIGGVFAERCGIVNINIEGQMLVGAFASFITAYLTNNLWIGLLVGMAAGMLLSLILAICAITFRIDQTITGIALNMFSSGATSFGYWMIFGVMTTTPIIGKFASVSIPGLSSIPFLGEILFNHSIAVYIVYVLIIVSFIVLFRTTFGLKMRACGEHPRAAETMGVNVVKMRYSGMLICGAFTGLGGAILSLVSLGMFSDDITAGKGFVALAVVIFGRWNPLICALAALFFGTVDALQLRIQASGAEIAHQFLLMLPYVFTLLTMMLTSKNNAAPASTGIPYEKESQ